jgi:xylulokinase
MNCTVATEEFRALFGTDIGEFNAEAEKAPVGSEGIVVLPFFNGERTPNLPNGRASVNGITAANFNRANLARAALESAIFGMRIGLERFNELGFKAKEIRLTGGGAKSPLWQEIAANVMNLPVRVPAATEAAAMGSAIQALWCLQTRKPAPAKDVPSEDDPPPKDGESKKVSIKDLAEEHVVLESGVTVKPDKKAVAAYTKAYAVYSKYLGALSPLYK